jgi:tol-pal system protein YbgF
MPNAPRRRVMRVIAAFFLLAGCLAAGGAAAQQSYQAQIEVRLQSLEQQIRALTGQVEQLQYENQQLSDRLERALSDIEYRLTVLEGGDPSSLSAEPTPPASGGIAPPLAPAPPPAAPPAAGGGFQAPLPLVPPRRSDLDAVPQAPGTTGGWQPQAGGPQPGFDVGTAAIAPTADPAAQSDPMEQYNDALGYMSRQDYPGAIRAFNAFLRTSPSNGLAANARFWLGEAYLQQGLYPDAVDSFDGAYRANPDGPKAVDSLYRLGQTLEIMGRVGDACAVFAQLVARHPGGQPQFVQGARTEQAHLNC